MASAGPVQANDLAQQIEEHRAGLMGHCYRMLGSFHDAEDATQEALLRAWRKQDGFRGDASLKTWLYRIATHVCLDLLRSRARRLTPASEAAPRSRHSLPKAPATEISWLEPLPTGAVRTDLDPAAAYSQTESVKLAFIAALQSLTPGQRAVLILRDVLAWSTAETAETLGLSEPAASSALHRARQRLRETYHPTGVDASPRSDPEDPRVRTMLVAYVDAWRRSDVDGLVEALRTDVRIAMPPSPSWYRGRDDVLEFLRTLDLAARRAPAASGVVQRPACLPDLARRARARDPLRHPGPGRRPRWHLGHRLLRPGAVNAVGPCHRRPGRVRSAGHGDATQELSWRPR